MKALIETIYDSREGKDLKKLVGSIVVHFVQCELLCSMLVDLIVPISKSGRLVFENHLNSEKRISEYRKILIKKKSSSKIEHKIVSAWIDDLEKLKHYRNQVVHSAWIPFIGLNEYDRNLIHEFSKGKRKLQRERMTKVELEKIKIDITNLHSQGWEIFHKIFPFKASTKRTRSVTKIHRNGVIYDCNYLSMAINM